MLLATKAKTSATIATVQVDVVDDVLSVNPELVVAVGEPCTLLFQLTNPDYSFPTIGAIVIEGGHKSQFPDPPVWVDASTVTLLDRNCNRQPRNFKYTVTVLDSLGHRHSLDPMISNEGGPGLGSD